MALFSHSESAYLTSFLSAVDLDSSISPDGSVDPGVADRVPHLQGSEALAKATKDLMALDVPVSSPYYPAPQQQTNHVERGRNSAPNYWPSIGPPDSGAALFSATLKYGTSGVRSSSPANYLARGLSSSISPSDASRSAPKLERPGFNSSSIFATHPASQPHLQIAPLRGFDHPTASSSFTLPPISTTGISNGRPLPTTLQTTTDSSTAKRVRRSSSSTPFSSTSAAPDAEPPKPRRSASGASKGNPAAPPSTSTGGAGSSNNKGTLLSPSQKRANHIQSEQKRRANIRRGYEALCDAVPALREAIRAEEEGERAKDAEGYDDPSGKGKVRAGPEKGKKKKGRAEADKPDGRAGPRSENVVLQKTIDYITGLLAEQASLKQRMRARWRNDTYPQDWRFCD
ncbi:hypothetical protein C8Q80DRAFT_1269330 [Daedaleopsis nitida]|nr:hypothetical protein C8Q80DRAFT_1269330 [Daedaleopsis nitida]